MATQKIRDDSLLPNPSRDGNGPGLNVNTFRSVPIRGGFGSGVSGSERIWEFIL